MSSYDISLDTLFLPFFIVIYYRHICEYLYCFSCFRIFLLNFFFECLDDTTVSVCPSICLSTCL